MAVDSVVDAGVLDQGLSQIAQAIRDRAGTQGSLSFPGGMAQAIADIPHTLWGRKMVFGRFQPSTTLTGEYVLATAEDSVLQGLLGAGESWEDVYSTVGVLVMRRATQSFSASQNANTLGGALRVVGYPGGAYSVRQYWNGVGGSSSLIGGITVTKEKIAISFASVCAGPSSFTYEWIAWRHL